MAIASQVDPMFRDDEGYAAAVVQHVLGVRVEARDTPGAPRGTVDGEIIYPDGRTAALEITSVEPSSDRHLRARLDRMTPTSAPGRLTWSIHPRTVAELERLVEIHVRVLLECERHGVGDPGNLPVELIARDPDLEWLAWGEARSDMHGYLLDAEPRVLWLHPIEVAVFSSEGEAIAAGVAEALTAEPCAGHIAKLLCDPHDERHLFLIVGTTGLSTAAAYALIEPEDVPIVDPEMPDGIDHLWLGPGWGATATVWTRGRGWRIESMGAQQSRDDVRARRLRQTEPR